MGRGRRSKAPAVLKACNWLAAGAAYATDARIANVLLVLPGLLRRLLDARASALDQGAVLAAARALAAYEPTLEWLDPLDRHIHESVRRAVAEEVGS
jgi:malic enzyme